MQLPALFGLSANIGSTLLLNPSDPLFATVSGRCLLSALRLPLCYHNGCAIIAFQLRSTMHSNSFWARIICIMVCALGVMKPLVFGSCDNNVCEKTGATTSMERRQRESDMAISLAR